MEKALIIVDPQNDFCEGGALGVTHSKQIFPIINDLRNRKLFKHIFVTMDWHPQNHVSFAQNHKLPPFTAKNIKGEDQMLWPVHCVQDTNGAKLSELLQTAQNDIIVKKGLIVDEEQYSGFGTKANPTQLEAKLKQLNITEVVVVGLALDYCVGSTALDAKKAGFQVIVIEQGTKPVSVKGGQEMIEKFAKQGIQYKKVKDFLSEAK